jgi:hypothetical protein
VRLEVLPELRDHVGVAGVGERGHLVEHGFPELGDDASSIGNQRCLHRGHHACRRELIFGSDPHECVIYTKNSR